ncbi:MAG: hypothetical protein JSV49_01930 [Thermoplasmata archaeon]|nr:MAG: hypothetical protein JSV49_01930 [Thermoplasmata archaeon]
MTITKRTHFALIIITIVLFATFAGCFGDDEKSKSSPPPLEEYSGSQSLSGWIDSEGGDNPTSVSHAVVMDLNSSKLSYVEVTVTIDDFDNDHAGTDDGSDPDEFTIKINSSGQESKTASGTTPGTVILELPASNATVGSDAEVPEFGPKLTIMIEAVCHGGAGFFRPGQIVPPFIIYLDQGITYSINVEYKYFDEPGAGEESAE